MQAIDAVVSQSSTIWDVRVHPACEFLANHTFGAIEDQLVKFCYKSWMEEGLVS